MSKIHNNWRVFLAEKTFQDFSQGEKDKWIELAYDELMADKAATAAGEDTVNKELYDLIDVSYANIGGHVSFTSANDMPSDYQNWEAADVDDDPQPDAVIFGKGNKYSGGAADGSPEGKKAMLDKTAEFLNTHGKYGEFSDALAHIMMTRYNIASVNDEQAVRSILNKDIEWVGANPNGKYPNHTGWYMRMLADGKAHMKIILGHPQQATALQKIEDEALAEIKDYSTGKKYFVSKFQDSVRKRNIKAKKKLIGYGNEGALSGAGAMEETIEIDEGIMQFLGLQSQKKPEQTPTQEEYFNYSQPDESKQLYIGAFPTIHDGEIDDAKNKFDVIINMSTDVVSIFGNNEKYKQYKRENFIVDDFAVDDVDFTESEMEILKSTKEEDIQKIVQLEDKIEKENARIGSAADKAAKLVNSGNRVLIVCSEGRNRSAVTTIMAMIILGKTNKEAYDAVRIARKITFNRLELRHANLRQTRPKKINDEILSFGRVSSNPQPHTKYRNLVGISERLKKMLAKLIKEEYNKLIKAS